MDYKERYVNGYEGKKLFLYVWDQVNNPKGVVQIIHGMAEHGGRYKEFAEFLNKNGFIVYAEDHRGHGNSVNNISELGVIGEDGFNSIVKDEYIINEIIKEEYPELPVVILGHSFGSFIAQEFLLKYSDKIDGCILSGSAARTGFDVKLGRFLAGIQIKLFGESKEGKLLDKISFFGYNNKIEKSNSKFDWLSRDTKEVNKYIDDDLCGNVASIGFFYYLFDAFTKMYIKDRVDDNLKEKPIMILSGEQDPVGIYGKAVKKLYGLYKSYGLKKVEMKLYRGARHEILNEINKREVFKDIHEYLIKII